MDSIKRMWRYRKEAVIADHRIDIMSMMMWLLLGTWGILSTVQQVTILKETINWYPVVWGSSIATLCLLAFIGVLMIFMVPHNDYRSRIQWKQLELTAVSILACVIAVYPVLMFKGLFDDSPRPDLFVLSLTYLIVPIWRIGHLRSRIANLEISKAVQPHG